MYAQGALCDLKYNFCAKNLRLVKKKLQPSRNFCSHTKTKNHKNVEFCIIFVISCHFKHNITYFLTFQFWCWLARVACGVARSVVSRLRWVAGTSVAGTWVATGVAAASVAASASVASASLASASRSTSLAAVSALFSR